MDPWLPSTCWCWTLSISAFGQVCYFSRLYYCCTLWKVYSSCVACKWLRAATLLPCLVNSQIIATCQSVLVMLPSFKHFSWCNSGRWRVAIWPLSTWSCRSIEEGPLGFWCASVEEFYRSCKWTFTFFFERDAPCFAPTMFHFVHSVFVPVSLLKFLFCTDCRPYAEGSSTLASPTSIRRWTGSSAPWGASQPLFLFRFRVYGHVWLTHFFAELLQNEWVWNSFMLSYIRLVRSWSEALMAKLLT